MKITQSKSAMIHYSTSAMIVGTRSEFQFIQDMAATMRVPLHGTLACIKQSLELNKVLIRSQLVHSGLVVVQEDVSMGLQHSLQFRLQDLVVQTEESNEVVQVLVVHVVELAVLQLDVIHVTVDASVQSNNSIHEVTWSLLIEQLQGSGTTEHHRGYGSTS